LLFVLLMEIIQSHVIDVAVYFGSCCLFCSWKLYSH